MSLGNNLCSLQGAVREKKKSILYHNHSYIYIYIYFKNTKNLFIHIAHYPVRRFLRDIPTFLKCPLQSLVGAGVGNDRYQGDSAHET